MDFYSRLFSDYNHTVAQLLLTKDVVDNSVLKENAVNTFETILTFGAVPIVNENDSISAEQIEFGDNDTLSAIVAKLVGADLLIILSDIDGLYDKDPSTPEAKLISRVEGVTDEVRALAGGAGSNRGTGGMITKLAAAEIANGDQVSVDFATGTITDETTGKTYHATAFPPFIQKIIAHGGLLSYLKARQQNTEAE